MRYKPGDLTNKIYVEEKVQRRGTKIYAVFQLRLSSARSYNIIAVINIATILTDDMKKLTNVSKATLNGPAAPSPSSKNTKWEHTKHRKKMKTSANFFMARGVS